LESASQELHSFRIPLCKNYWTSINLKTLIIGIRLCLGEI
jgi:hypothetical protein